jgi:hypothetical protein
LLLTGNIADKKEVLLILVFAVLPLQLFGQNLISNSRQLQEYLRWNQVNAGLDSVKGLLMVIYATTSYLFYLQEKLR